MIEILVRVEEIPGKDTVGMEIIWHSKDKSNTPIENRFAKSIIDLLSAGPQIKGIDKLGEWSTNRPNNS